MTKRELERQKWRERRINSTTNEFNLEEATGLVSSFKKKTVRRMKAFYEESQRMDKKFPELVAKAKELGIEIVKITANSVNVEDVKNGRKKNKGGFSFDVLATREKYRLEGQLAVTPASMRLELNSPQLNGVRTKSGFPLPLLKITYYRTLNVRDNWLPALLNGPNKYYNDKIGDVEF